VLERVVSPPSDYSAVYLRVAAGTTYLGSNARAQRELGYAPRPLEQGLPELLEYELAQLAT